MNFTTRSLALLALGASSGVAPVAAAVTDAAPAAATPPGYHLLRKVVLPGADGWDYLTLDSGARRLYIPRSSHVTVVNVDTGELAGDIPDTAGVHGIAIDAKDGRGFTSNGRTATVTIFDLKTLKKIDEVKVDQGPDAILFDPATNRVFTFNGRAQSATAIDAATGKVAGTVPLPGRPEAGVSDGQGHLYNNIEDKSEVVAIDARTLKVDNVWPIAPGDGPSGLALDQKNHRLFAVCGNQKMIVVDAGSGHVVATPAIGNGPDACAYDADKSLVFAPNGRDGTLTVLRQAGPDQYQTVETVATQSGARTLALDEKTHHIFTVAAQVAPAPAGATAPRRGRRYVDGSVMVLEYGP